ncbi:MAG: zinc-dependent metalloprotease [Aquabacterium sp.]|uniref:zinc-dependent metalloprotease n=1 Tax=Aquabacterium sp. TaxID=1872578 RepID=UPI002A36BD01|nr:zinc-dependent metalloprotease [Aquabacterium sp.]MDX9844504.1 zinc-dependent metalloprotease [Aquabacterium sp.]
MQGAQRHDGLLPLWRKDDKVWLELSPQTLGKPLFFSPKLASGIGEAGLFGGLMQSRWAQVGRPQWVTFRQVHKQVQLLAVNAAYTAEAGTPQARAVEAAFSPSLLGSAPLASAPHPKTGAVLIDLTPMLLSDMLGLGMQLQRTYRQGYSLDARNSTVRQARTTASQAVFEVTQHFATSNLAVPTPGAAGAAGAPSPSTPQAVPDPRSLFLTVHYTLSALPEQPMRARPADARVGYFTTTVTDFTDDLARTPRQHFINRWRLSKKDPNAPLSEPVQPIVFWLDPSIPQAYRATVTEGVLAWNRAFEAIGYRNAIEVRTPAPGQALDTLATGQASIRWMTNAQPRFGAIGPSHVDPRTGEILGADIALESLSSRSIRTVRSQILTSTAPHADHQHDAHDAHCEHGALAAEQLALGLDVLEARGVIDPDSPQVRDFVLAYLKDTTMHEVGHTLGLRHNFRASRWRTAQELTHPQLTATQGISASVMEYSPINLPAPGQSAGAPFQTTLGPYDFWAIAYGYGDLPEDPVQAKAALKALAQRSAEPAMADALAYGTDEDNSGGLDPQALTFDLGRDPVAFARTRVAIVRDLLARQATRVLTPQDDATLLRRSVSYGLRDLARTSQTLMRQVGGVITRRDAPGSGRDLLEPLPAAAQREALQLLLQDFLSDRAVALPPALLRRLAPDYLDREASSGTDFSVAEQLLSLQRAVLNHLMADSLAERLLDNADKVRDRESRPLTVAELHQGLRQAVWSPPHHKAQVAAASWQRNLQREHVSRLAASVLRSSGGRADARAIVRLEAETLLRQLQASASADRTEQAHRRACIEILQGALQARVMRTSP